MKEKNVIIVATHKKYEMPKESCYLPLFVGSSGKQGIGFQRDDEGENISIKNPYYCELTGLYWGWKNLECEYMGLVHYRRFFSDNNKKDILSDEKLNKLVEKNDIILPKKRNYFIETIYSHYSHTHYEEDLIATRKVIEDKYPHYLEAFDFVMKKKKAHMFNMYIMKKTYSDQYCDWLFDILFELERRINISGYDSFQSRVFGRISEILLNVWIEEGNYKYKEIEYINLEKINWIEKGKAFLFAKFKKRKYNKSF